MLKVNVGKNEPVDQAMRRLQKKVQRAGVIAEVKRRRAYESRNGRTKRRVASTIRRNRKRAGLPI